MTDSFINEEILIAEFADFNKFITFIMKDKIK